MKKIAIMVALALAACTHVDAGHVGVEVDSCENGGISKDPVGVGYHGVGPCVSIYEYPTYQQTLTLDRAGDSDESITVGSSEGMRVNIDVTLSFTTDPKMVPTIYGKFKSELGGIMHSYMRNMVKEDVQKVFRQYTAQQLYSDKNEAARAEVQDLLTHKLKSDGFVVTQFTLNRTDVPKAIEEAINAKVAMIQMSQQAEQAVKKSEAEGRQRIAKATADAETLKLQTQAEADAKRIAADATAYANKAIAASVSRELIDYQRAQKWDGVLPKVTGGGSGLILGNDAIK